MRRGPLPIPRRRFSGGEGEQDCYQGLPPDTWGRPTYVGEKQPGVVDRISSPPDWLGTAIYLRRGFQGRSVLVGTTPTLIQRSEYAYPYLILNPSLSAGLTNSFTVATLVGVNVAGNTIAAPIGVANFMDMHFHLIVTAVGGAWDFIMMSRDPVNGSWADVQTVFAAVAALPVAPATSFYAFVGSMGVAVDMAFRWNPVAPGVITVTLIGTSKDGVAGSSAGLAQTVFLGGNDSISVNSGYPVLPGQEKQLIIGDNVELWGVANTPITINVFEL